MVCQTQHISKSLKKIRACHFLLLSNALIKKIGFFGKLNFGSSPFNRNKMTFSYWLKTMKLLKWNDKAIILAQNISNFSFIFFAYWRCNKLETHQVYLTLFIPKEDQCWFLLMHKTAAPKIRCFSLITETKIAHLPELWLGVLRFHIDFFLKLQSLF